jgi:hypothetical protein
VADDDQPSERRSVDIVILDRLHIDSDGFAARTRCSGSSIDRQALRVLACGYVSQRVFFIDA